VTRKLVTTGDFGRQSTTRKGRTCLEMLMFSTRSGKPGFSARFYRSVGKLPVCCLLGALER
jgi:hypothetical protein